MKEVVVIETYYKMSLPIIRSLGKRGIKVHAVDFKFRENKSQGMYSKYTSSKAYVSDPSVSISDFSDELIKIGKKIFDITGEKPVLIMAGARSLKAVRSQRDKISTVFDFLISDIDAHNALEDKRGLDKISKELGIKYPKVLNNDKDFDIESFDFTGKVVVKYENSENIGVNKGLKPSDRYKIVESKTELISEYKKMAQNSDKLLLQEYVTGSAYGVSVLFSNESEPLAIFCHKRLREYPITGGPSTYCQAVNLPDKINYAIKLLKSLNWVGFAMVEFKGEHLIEVNPRLWGSFALSYYAGCDMPYIYYKYFLGFNNNDPEIQELKNYKDGYRLRFLRSDLKAIFAYFSQNKSVENFLKSILKIFDSGKIGDIELSDLSPLINAIKIKFTRKG